uniref:Uncharacterized protein n=1 Tax=Meloidogyne enterolobii TaxID=390850 RepID=A0A6V7W9Z9_MELEN|nr:unnamed protein product [Meloidogyne enterolobii]
MLSYKDIYDDAIYYFHDNCYYEEEKFEEYCYMDKMSTPINARFDTTYMMLNSLLMNLLTVRGIQLCSL